MAATSTIPANPAELPRDASAWRERYLALKRMLALRDSVARLCDEALAGGCAIVQPIRLPENLQARPLRYFHVDRFCVENDDGCIVGWAFEPAWDPRTTRIIIQLEGPGRFLIPAAPCRRLDVAAVHRGAADLENTPCLAGLDLCGFQVRFVRRVLPAGSYAARLWLARDHEFATGLASPVLELAPSLQQAVPPCE